MTDFGDKNVVVTGATGGLGTAVVATLLERGAICHLPMVEKEVPKQLPWYGHARVHAHPGENLDDELRVTAFYDELPALWASIHLVGGFSMAPLTETPVSEFQRMFTLNAVTCFLGTREAVRAIRRSRGGGRIVNVAARPVLQPAGGMVAYSASKAAVAAITTAAAAETLTDGILVNAVLPSIIDTPANRVAMPHADHSNWPKAEQIAETIAFLASPQNSLTSGTMLPVYGRA